MRLDFLLKIIEEDELLVTALLAVVEDFAVLLHEVVLELLEFLVHYDLLHVENDQIEFIVFRRISTF